jgi:hypothetical protein
MNTQNWADKIPRATKKKTDKIFLLAFLLIEQKKNIEKNIKKAQSSRNNILFIDKKKKEKFH